MPNKFVAKLEQDPELRERFKERPEEVQAQQMDLSEGEKERPWQSAQMEQEVELLPAPWIPPSSIVTQFDPKEGVAGADVTVTFYVTRSSREDYVPQLRKGTVTVNATGVTAVQSGPNHTYYFKANFHLPSSPTGAYDVYAMSGESEDKKLDIQFTVNAPKAPR